MNNFSKQEQTVLDLIDAIARVYRAFKQLFAGTALAGHLGIEPISPSRRPDLGRTAIYSARCYPEPLLDRRRAPFIVTRHRQG